MGMCLDRGTSLSTTMAIQEEQDAQGAGCSNETSEFVNHGLRLWNENRQNWVGHKKATTQSQWLLLLKSKRLRFCCMDSGKGNDELLKTGKPFAKPVPLGEMVDFLVDVWEEEGMYEMV